MGFDFKQFLNYDPPTAVCPGCFVILLASEIRMLEKRIFNYFLNDYPERAKREREQTHQLKQKYGPEWYKYVEFEEEEEEEEQQFWFQCPVCGGGFGPDYIGLPQHLTNPHEQTDFIMSIFEEPTNPWLVTFKSLSFDKCLHTLEPIFAYNFNQDPTSDIIIQTLLRAKRFVHFATYSIDRFFEGILKALSSKDPPIDIRGVIGNAEILTRKWTRLQEGCQSYTNMEIYFDRSQQKTHQKILIIDGILAFTGSVNLTQDALNKIEGPTPKEHIQAITDIETVKDLNNRYFSPVFLQARKLYYEEQHKLRQQQNADNENEAPF